MGMKDALDRLVAARGDGDSERFRHRSVAEQLRRWVISGQFVGGTKLPALREIASQLKVSTTTVRRALRTLANEGHVHQISRLGAFVGGPQRRGRVARMVAFAAGDLSYALDMGIAHGIQAACNERGLDLQIFDAHVDPDRELRNFQCLSEGGLRGAIILPIGSPDSVDLLFRLHVTGFPLVLVDRPVPGLTADLVQSDHEKGAYIATRYLIGKEHRRILALVPPARLVSPILARIHGYERALSEAGIHPAPEWKIAVDPTTVNNDLRMQGYFAILPVLKQVELPIAIFALRDYLGWGVYRACQELGLRIPQDVSVLGFDDSDVSRAMLPPMTVVAQRNERIGQQALNLLEQHFDNGVQDGSDRVFSHVLIDLDLIERESVADLRART
ncbi:MAG: GntR family transcriptional regulator [Planctomycetes bacterium]|nr:GntR family transcriptional regulator [Planctomycetota bacterium]